MSVLSDLKFLNVGQGFLTLVTELNLNSMQLDTKVIGSHIGKDMQLDNK